MTVGTLGARHITPTIKDRAELGEGWRLEPWPKTVAERWVGTAVMLKRPVARLTTDRESAVANRKSTSNEQVLVLIRSDAHESSAATLFRRKVLEQIAANAEFVLTTAAVLSDLIGEDRNSGKQAGFAITKVTNHERQGYDLVLQAIESKASDIHIEMLSTGRVAPFFRIRIRVDGTLRLIQVGRTARELEDLQAVITTLYQNTDIAKTDEKYPAFFSPLTRCFARITPPVRNAELRFESNPTVGGYKVVIRVLTYDGRSTASSSLVKLGFSPMMERDLLRAFRAPSGLILVVGATGSGKTTTIATALEMDPNKADKVRLGMEMPPEIDIDEMLQYRVTPDTLSSVAVGVMRSDPDLIYAGEINDHNTVLMAQDFAMTGHITPATFHANNVATALMRLIDDKFRMSVTLLGMERFLRAVLYQELVGVLCSECKVPADSALDDEQIEVLAVKFGLPIQNMYVRYRPLDKDERPCHVCKGTGLTGRTAIVEMVVPNRKFLSFVLKQDINGAMDYYRSFRNTGFADFDTTGKTVIEHAMAKAAHGITCALELFDREDLYNYEIQPLNQPLKERVTASPSGRSYRGEAA